MISIYFVLEYDSFARIVEVKVEKEKIVILFGVSKKEIK
jgi:hypothetical protein